MITLNETPVEVHHTIHGLPIHVKREDLCWAYPPLSKARGVWGAIEARPEAEVIGVVDTGRSLNGILVATIAMTLGRSVVVGYPRYVGNPDEIPGSANRAKSIGATIVPIPANRQFVMRHTMAQHLTQTYAPTNHGWYLFPTGLRLPETVTAVAAEAAKVWDQLGGIGTMVVPTGTGTHLAGIVRALHQTWPWLKIIAVQGYGRPVDRFLRDVERAAGCPVNRDRLHVVDLGFGYYEFGDQLVPPFPANPHYEIRCWNWLSQPSAENLPKPIVLWNIGA